MMPMKIIRIKRTAREIAAMMAASVKIVSGRWISPDKIKRDNDRLCLRNRTYRRNRTPSNVSRKTATGIPEWVICSRNLAFQRYDLLSFSL